MSSQKFADTLSRNPEWAEDLIAIRNALAKFAKGEAVSPALISFMTEITAEKVFAYLNIFRKTGLGTLLFQVVDGRGRVISRFENLRLVPPRVEDQYGETVNVTPQNLELVFVPEL
jgi:hypothetical protein